MKHSLEIEKSILVNVQGNMVKVSSLPDDLKYEIATLDKMRQDRLDAMYHYEVIEHAVKAKESMIEKMILTSIAPKQDTDLINADK